MELRLTVAAVVVAASAVPALAADRQVGRGRTYATIQAAVDAASDGDRIVIAKGRYRESVAVAGKSLSFLGRKGVVWDGRGSDGSEGDCLDWSGTDLTVSGIEFRNGRTHLSLVGDRVKIQRCTFTDSQRTTIDVTGNDVLVDRSIVRGAGDIGVRVSGDRCTIRGTRVNQADNSGISIGGTDAVVASCTVTLVEDGTACGVSGDRATVSGCTIRNADGAGLSVSGRDARVVSNRVEVCADGFLISVDGDAAEVTSNRVAMAHAGGIYVRGDEVTVSSNVVDGITGGTGISILATEIGRATVARNTVSHVYGEAMYVESFRAEVTSCTIRESGAYGGAAFRLVANSAVVTSCTVTDSVGAAFFDSGSGNRFVRCAATGATNDGFRVSGTDATLDACTARGCDGDGLENGGIATVVTGCTFRDNRLDLARTFAGTWASPGEVSSSNSYETGGPDVFTEGN